MAIRSTIGRAAATALVLVTIVSSAPTAVPDSTAERLRSHLEARDTQSPISGLPGCSISDQGKPDNQDPTWAVGKSNYTDGQGTWVSTDCDNHVSGSGHCWTEYWLVGTKQSFKDWYNVMGDIQCDGNCQQSTADMSQNCTTSEWSVSSTVSTDFDAFFAKGGVSVTVESSKSYQSCNSKTNTNQCSWSDNNCHSVWAAQGVTTAYGYTRRRCNSPAGAAGVNMPNQPANPAGHDAYTRGIMDFAIPLAAPSYITCDGTCAADYSPGASPPVDSNLKPWSS